MKFRGWIGGLMLFAAIGGIAAADDRLPLPTAGEASAAEAQIKDLFKDELAKARPADRSALAN